MARLGGLTSGTSWGKLMTDLRSAHVSVGGESMQTLSASPTLPPGAKAGAGFAVLIANPYSQRAKSNIQLGTRGCGLTAVWQYENLPDHFEVFENDNTASIWK